MSDTFLQQLAFTCANCGNQQRFLPSEPRPCTGCKATRWILGNDTKLFDWKQGLTVVRRTDRAQLAQIVRGELLTLSSADSDPLVDTLREVQTSGFDLAAEPRECGHPMAAWRDGCCSVCAMENHLRSELENERNRAESFGSELSTWMKKVEEAQADTRALIHDVETTTGDLARSQDRVAVLEAQVENLNAVILSNTVPATKIQQLESELADLRRENSQQSRLFNDAHRKLREADAERFAAVSEALSKQAASYAPKLEEISKLRNDVVQARAEYAELRKQTDAAIRHAEQIKHGYEHSLQTATSAKAEVDQLSQSLQAEVESLGRELAALKREQEEGWLGKDNVIQLDADRKRLERELQLAKDDLAAAIKREAERPVPTIEGRDDSVQCELDAAKKQIAMLQNQADQSWLGKDAVIALDKEKTGLERALKLANANISALTKERDEALWRKESIAELEAEKAKLVDELEVATRRLDALTKDQGSAIDYRDKAIEMEIVIEKVTREADIAKSIVHDASKERDAVIERLVQLNEIETLNTAELVEMSRKIEALTSQRDELMPYRDRSIELEVKMENMVRELKLLRANADRTTAERDELTPYRDRVIEFEVKMEAVVRELELLRANTDKITAERDEAMKYFDRAVQLDSEVAALRKQAEITNGNFDAIRQRLQQAATQLDAIRPEGA